MQERYPNNPKVMRAYSRFLQQVRYKTLSNSVVAGGCCWLLTPLHNPVLTSPMCIASAG